MSNGVDIKCKSRTDELLKRACNGESCNDIVPKSNVEKLLVELNSKIGSGNIEEVAELPSATVETKVTVPNKGYVDKVYFNTDLSTEEIETILSRLTYDPDMMNSNTLFASVDVIPNSFGMPKTMFVAIGGDGMYALLNFSTMEIYWANQLAVDVLGPQMGIEGVTAGWQDFDNPIIVDDYANIDINGDGSVMAGVQNELIKDLFYTQVPTPNPDVNLDKVYRTPTYSPVVGTTVPNTGYVEKVYFNTSLSVDEVERLLSKLTYIEDESGMDFDNSNLLLCRGNENVDCCITAYKDNDACLLIDMMSQKIYWANQAAINATTFDLNKVGWQDFTNPIEINAEVLSEMFVPVGTQNSIIKDLFSITPFEPVQSGYKYYRVINNKWTEVFNDNPFVEVEELPLLNYSVPAGGYIEKIYVNKKLTNEELVNIFENVLGESDGSSGMIVLADTNNASIIVCVEKHEGKWKIHKDLDHGLVNGSYWTEDDGWTLQSDAIEVAGHNFLEAYVLSGLKIYNDKLSEVFSIKPFGTKPEYELDKIYRLPIKSYGGTAVPKEDVGGTIYFNTNLTEKEVEKIIANLPYGGTGQFPCYTVVASVDEVGVPQNDLTVAGAMGAYAIMDAFNARIYWANETAVALMGEDFGVSTSGWQSYKSDTFGANVTEYNGTQVGTQNKLLKDLFSTTPFKNQEIVGYKYYRVVDGKYIEVLGDSTDKVVIDIPSAEFTFTPEQMELIKEDKVILRFSGGELPITFTLNKTVDSDLMYGYQGWFGDTIIHCTIDPSTSKFTMNDSKQVHSGTLQFVNDVHVYDFEVWNGGEPVGRFSIPTTSTIDESDTVPTSKAVKDYVDEYISNYMSTNYDNGDTEEF